MNILKSKRADGNIGAAISVMISVVLGGLILLGTISLIDNQVAPALGNTLNKQGNQEIVNTVDLQFREPNDYIVGDINQDNKIDINDVNILERHINGWADYNYHTTNVELYDVNGDSIINDEDVVFLNNVILNGGNFTPFGYSYFSTRTNKFYSGGKWLPAINDKDYCETEDYRYEYSESLGGWKVSVKDKSKTHYSSLSTYLNTQPVVSLNSAWATSNIEVAPVIPDTVKDLSYAFYMCDKLTVAPNIPYGVITMVRTFGSTTFESMPVIPDSVENMSECFSGSMIKDVTPIPSSVNNLYRCFYSCGYISGEHIVINSVYSNTNFNEIFDSAHLLDTTIAGVDPATVAYLETTYDIQIAHPYTEITMLPKGASYGSDFIVGSSTVSTTQGAGFMLPVTFATNADGVIYNGYEYRYGQMWDATTQTWHLSNGYWGYKKIGDTSDAPLKKIGGFDVGVYSYSKYVFTISVNNSAYNVECRYPETWNTLIANGVNNKLGGIVITIDADGYIKIVSTATYDEGFLYYNGSKVTGNDSIYAGTEYSVTLTN